ncbi:DUF3617 domain-containing protein [Phytopseudomonas dryadis]|uniref:DUF3617 domain-containing protein n=1 Tax=Phytopseudomonas dryadis TaxID=2487520 RepID=A0A4Q9R1N2_9GAMM|nr:MULTISPECIES: DUF3617 domain-containing protein [Pseudomonas]TBU92060.1 DUF3617 domain-containing protein [Pseudomonas dryadis]TBV04360.1 DUF3617 domain-containing protein [Pseudomonas dryadis]TBV17086.1 DUF3617 domain-containing protein [Pseudomonas sp. FRB 230]
MPMSSLKFLPCCLLLLPLLASAQQQIQPGLWEITSKNMQLGGQALPSMEVMLQQFRNLPPAQREMMEKAMAGQGIQLGSKGVQYCISQAQIDAQNIPLQDPNCRQQITSRSDDRWVFNFTCPQGQGQGEAHFLDDKSFTSQVSGEFDNGAGRQHGSMESEARWVSADCGALKPNQP